MPIEEEHYRQAKKSLKLFNYCIVLEDAEPLTKLSRFLGWKAKELHENRDKIDCSALLKQIVKGNLQPLLRRLLHQRTKRDPGFIEFYSRANHWDFKIYREWYELSAEAKAE